MFRKEYMRSGFVPCHRPEQGPDAMTDWLIVVGSRMAVVSGDRD